MNCPTCGGPMKTANDNDEAVFEQVVEALRKRGFEAEVWASGGGIDVILLTHGAHVFYFGTAAELWGADVYDTEDNHIGTAWTQVSSNQTNPEVVADGIAAAATEYER